MSGSIIGDFFGDIGKGLDNLFEGNVLGGLGNIVGGTLKGAVRTVGFAGKTIGDIVETIFADGEISSEDIPSGERQGYAIMSLVAMLAKMAKADGRVSKAETQFLSSVLDEFDLDENDKSELKKFANKEARGDDITVFRWAQLFSAATENNGELAAYVYVLLWRMALLVGKISEDQDDILRDIPEDLGLDDDVYYYVCEHPEVLEGNQEAGGQQDENSLEACYAVLGCSPDVSNVEVKCCYKVQIAQYHPDTISGKDLAPGFVEFANQQSAKINSAYESIKAARGMR